MQAKQIVARVEELLKPLCEQAGVSLWDVEFEKEGGQYMLVVTVDNPEGVFIDQCEQVSRTQLMLDAKGVRQYALLYTVCFLGRPVAQAEKAGIFLGHTVEVGFYKPVNGAKQVEGTLIAYDNGCVTIESGGQQTIYEPKDIAAVRLAVEI